MGWFKSLTKAVARLDRATNPIHKAVQDQITKDQFHGNQELAITTAHGIGVTVVDIVGGVFGYPGLGSALNSTDQLQDKNYKGATLSAASAVIQYAGAPSTAGYDSLFGQSATVANTASSSAAIADTAIVAYDAPTDYSAFFGPDKTVVGSGIYGYTGEIGSTVSGIPAGTYTIGTGGAIGIDYATAIDIGAPNLTLKDVRNAAGFVQKAVGVYDLVNRDGSVRATYSAPGTGAQQVTNFNLEYAPPVNLSLIPSNASADINGQLAAQHLADAKKQQQLKGAILALIAGIILFKVKK